MKTNLFLNGKAKERGFTGKRFAAEVNISEAYAKKLLAPGSRNLPSEDVVKWIVPALSLGGEEERELRRLIEEDRRELAGGPAASVPGPEGKEKEAPGKKASDETGHLYLRECVEKRVPLLMACHRERWKAGVIEDMTVYDIRFYDFKSKERKWFKKLWVKYFFRAEKGVSIKEFYRIDESVRGKGIKPARVVSERYQISDDLLKEALDGSHSVRVTSNEGEVFEGLILWFDRYHIQLELAAGVLIFFFRHGVCDFQVMQSGETGECPGRDIRERRESVMKMTLKGKDSKRLAREIRAKRQEKGLTQKKLGKKFGLSAGSIGWLEYGHIDKLKEVRVRKILAFLGIDATRFMGEDGKSSVADVIEKSDGAMEKVSPPEHKEGHVSLGVVKPSGSAEKGERLTPCTVSGKVTGEMYEKIREYGSKNGLGINEVVRRAVERFFEELERPEGLPAIVEAPPQVQEVSVELSAGEQEKIDETIEKSRDIVSGRGEGRKVEIIYEDEEKLEEDKEELAMCGEIEMLRKAGHRYETIGELMGLGAEKVKLVVEKEKIRKNELERKELAKQELRSLDVMQKILWDKVTKGSEAAMELVIRIMEHRAKLAGLV